MLAPHAEFYFDLAIRLFFFLNIWRSEMDGGRYPQVFPSNDKVALDAAWKLHPFLRNNSAPVWEEDFDFAIGRDETTEEPIFYFFKEGCWYSEAWSCEKEGRDWHTGVLDRCRPDNEYR